MVIENVEESGDSLTLRFAGENEDGTELHELRAAHVAEVLQGITGLAGDFTRAGAFGNALDSEILVRPAREGSFIIEVVRFAQEHHEAIVGTPTLGAVLWWATKSARADVKDFEYLDDDMVKVIWQDDTVAEIPRTAWEELNKRKRRRKRHLRQILAPLSDDRVQSLEVFDVPEEPGLPTSPPGEFTLTTADYIAAQPTDEVSETFTIFETEAQMSAIDFDSPEKWRVKTTAANRLATMEDADFLLRVDRGLAIHKGDIFRLKIREDVLEKNGQTRRTWTILQVLSHRRSANDDDDA